jgi:glycosyltransferase involved in cell wall biosynthesis
VTYETMKLAFANARFRPNAHDGANAHVRQFVQNTAALGHEVWMWPGVCHPAAKALPAGRVARTMKLRDMDMVYVRVQHDLVPPCTWTLGPTRKLLGDPLMVWEFNTVPEYGEYRGMSPQAIQKEIEGFRHFGRGCDLAVCVSAHLAEYVRTKLGIARTLVVPNGSDPDLYTPDAPVVPRLAGVGDEVFNVLWIGSAYVDWHNFKLLGDAAKIIWDRGNTQNIVFHLIGQGMSKMADMPANVHYYGVEDYEKLPRWMSAMDVGLCLYRSGPADYSSPLKVFDYMSSGLAVVATRQPQTQQLLSELGTPELLMSPDDPKALADALESLAADRPKVQEISKRARELSVAKYTWRRAVVDTFAEIEKIAAERKKPSGLKAAL